MMDHNVALVRQHVSKIAGVTRTWFEFSLDDNSIWAKTLVVEVDFDTDPNSSEFRQSTLDAIRETVAGVLIHETTMMVSRLRIVPKNELTKLRAYKHRRPRFLAGHKK